MAAIDRSTLQPSRRADGRRRSLLGIGAAVTSLFLAPPLFGVAGVLLGISGIRGGDRRLGWLAAALSIALSVFSAWLALQLVNWL